SRLTRPTRRSSTWRRLLRSQRLLPSLSSSARSSSRSPLPRKPLSRSRSLRSLRRPRSLSRSRRLWRRLSLRPPPLPPPRTRLFFSTRPRPPRLLWKRRIARRRSPRSSLRPARPLRLLLPSLAPGSRRPLAALLPSVSVPLLLQAVLSLPELALSSLVLTTFPPVFTTSHLMLALLPLVPSRRSMESGSALS
ncbi:hypothetical protein BGZ59_005635, partial [Podila verticillata]